MERPLAGGYRLRRAPVFVVRAGVLFVVRARVFGVRAGVFVVRTVSNRFSASRFPTVRKAAIFASCSLRGVVFPDSQP